ncbi:MAG: DNA-binding protein [Methylobacter sp.]|nr:DNA-binding protein [Methylobacter sp.]
MNNVSQINKAKRLSEEEVHAAAEELKESGIRPSSIEVYKFLGRGSLTTITNFLKTWDQADIQAATLPALAILPDTLKKAAELMIIKVWTESQELAEQEIKSQRDALHQAELKAVEKIAEAEAFSEEQSKQIEALENQIEAMQKDHDNKQTEFLKKIEAEHEEKNQAMIKIAVYEEKLHEKEKQFDFVNTALLDQQKTNQSLNEEIKRFELKAEQLESENQLLKQEKEKTLKNNDNLKEKLNGHANKINLLESDLEQEKMRINVVVDENSRLIKENRSLIEKTAMLDGQLSAWKEIKPKEKIKVKPEQLIQ